MFNYRSMFDLSGKNVLVVGAGRGMGQASAVGLAAFEASTYYANINFQAVQGVYTATQARERQIVRAPAAELGTNGIGVNAFAPAIVKTPLTAQIKNQPNRYRAYAQKALANGARSPARLFSQSQFLCHRQPHVCRRRLDRYCWLLHASSSIIRPNSSINRVRQQTRLFIQKSFGRGHLGLIHMH